MNERNFFPEDRQSFPRSAAATTQPHETTRLAVVARRLGGAEADGATQPLRRAHENVVSLVEDHLDRTEADLVRCAGRLDALARMSWIPKRSATLYRTLSDELRAFARVLSREPGRLEIPSRREG